MKTQTKFPKTLQEAIKYFADPDTCLEFMVSIRWSNGVTCPHCHSKEISFLSTRRIWKCLNCKKQFSAKVGTIFEDSPIGLDKWFAAMWMIVNAKNGISSYEIHRAIGVTQKTAWFMDHRIRIAMQTKTFEKLSGKVETDETYIGGKTENMHKAKRERMIQGRGTVGKTAVLGMLQRKGEVIANVIPNTKRGTLHNEITRNVNRGSEVFTDALPSYEGLDPEYVHQVIDHAIAHAIGQIHTNGIENFWSLLKRALKGTYIHVNPDHVFRYLDEEAFRFNNRTTDHAARFLLAASSVVGRRLTWKEMTGARTKACACSF